MFDILLTYAQSLALVAESVDALDLKSNRGSPSVPVQVWPGANLKNSHFNKWLFFMLYLKYAKGICEHYRQV